MIPAADDRRIDFAVLDLLLHEPQTGLWAVEELAHELGDPVDLQDSLRRLHGAGLIHRVESGFVFASRAARRAHELFMT
jgi:predicted transcriptional regulator